MIGQSIINVKSGGCARLSSAAAGAFLLALIPLAADVVAAVPMAALQAGFEVTEHLAAGEPEAVITRTVAERGIDLLVLGKSGDSRLRRLFIGSTTLDLMRNCTVPVLIFA